MSLYGDKFLQGKHTNDTHDNNYDLLLNLKKCKHGKLKDIAFMQHYIQLKCHNNDWGSVYFE